MGSAHDDYLWYGQLARDKELAEAVDRLAALPAPPPSDYDVLSSVADRAHRILSDTARPLLDRVCEANKVLVTGLNRQR